MRNYTTQMDAAKRGIITPEMKAVAAKEYRTEEEIREFCESLPRYKRPKKIIFEKVPRNPTGKIEKPVLRQKYCHGRLVEAQITG